MNTPLRHNREGFGAIEVLLILLVVVVLGGAGWYVWTREHNKTSVSNSSSQSSQNTTTPQPKPDPYAGWKVYADTAGHYSFKYPSGWTLTTSTATGTSASVHNPGNTVLVSYTNPFVKDAGTASFYDADNEAVAAISSLKIVGGAFTANMLPSYWVVDGSTVNTYPLTVGQTLTFTTAGRFTVQNSSSSAQLTAYPVGKVFTSTDQAKAWFSTDDAKTSLLILQSLTYEQ